MAPDLHEVDIHTAVAAASLQAGAGIRRIYDTLRTDGALPATHKAVAMAVAHAALGQSALVRRELARARALGMSRSLVAGASILLLIERGECATRELTLAAREIFGAAPEPDGPPAPQAARPAPQTADSPATPAERRTPTPDGSRPPTSAAAGSSAPATPSAPAAGAGASVDEALDYFREHFGGEIPYRQRLFAELAPGAFVGYRLLHEAALHDNPIPTRDGELLLCTALAAEYAFTLLEVHIVGARRAGATEAQVAEAILCAVPAAGVTVWAGGSGALLNARQALRSPTPEAA